MPQELPNNAKPIAKQFFANWRTWRLATGWRLGPDVPASKLHPFLVESWDHLDDEGQRWFLQLTVQVLFAAEQVNTAVQSSTLEHSIRADSKAGRSGHAKVKSLFLKSIG